MKKYILFAIFGFSALAMSAQGNNNQEQRARQKAEAAARQCANVQGMEIFSSATVTSICDYTHPSPNYFGYSVEVWATQRCPPNTICPAGPVVLLARVDISCNGDVAAVNCYASVQ